MIINALKRVTFFALIASISTLAACAPHYRSSFVTAQHDFSHQNYGRAYDEVIVPAHHGNRAAMYALGYLYYYGLGVPRDPDMGRIWIQHAADCGYPPAITAFREITIMKHEQTPTENERHRACTPPHTDNTRTPHPNGNFGGSCGRACALGVLSKAEPVSRQQTYLARKRPSIRRATRLAKRRATTVSQRNRLVYLPKPKKQPLRHKVVIKHFQSNEKLIPMPKLALPFKQAKQDGPNANRVMITYLRADDPRPIKTLIYDDLAYLDTVNQIPQELNV